MRSWLSNLAYHDEGRRDVRLDYLRGYALFAMAVNHAGLQSSPVRAFTGGGSFFVNAAEAFFFVAGFTLGFIAIGRPLGQTVNRLIGRLWTVYLATIILGVGFSVLSLATPFRLWGGAGDISGRDILSHLAGILTLHNGVSGSHVLITYVLYFCAAPLVLWALHRQRAGAVVLAVGGLYLLNQFDSAQTTLFPIHYRDLAANAPIFFGGMVLGYHRTDIGRWWSRLGVGPVLDGLTAILAVVLLHLYVCGFSWWPWLGEALGADRQLVRETTMPPLALLLVALYLRAAWLLVTALWRPIVWSTGWLMLRLGRASLFTYCFHLCALVVLFNTPGFSQDLGAWGATLYTVYYLGIVFAAVCVRDQVHAVVMLQRPAVHLVLSRAPIGMATVMVLVCAALSVTTSEPADAEMLVEKIPAEPAVAPLDERGTVVIVDDQSLP